MQTTLVAPRPTDGHRRQHYRTSMTDPNIFHIEDGIPVPKSNYKTPEITRESLNKLVYILNNMKIGQSFVFGNLSRGRVRKYLSEMFPELKTKIQLVSREKRWYRLWLLA